MKGKSKSLRLGLLALIVALVLSAMGSLSLARDAFDTDYVDCSQRTRLSSVAGLAVERTDKDDEIRVSWDALDLTGLNALGPNVLKSRLTVIVEGGGDEDALNVALGDTGLVVDNVDFTKVLTVSVAITLGNYVISDISETEFTSGMPAPSFKTDILANVGDPLTPSETVYGDFYYLGFNDLFDNWYVTDKGTPSITTSPASARFRVGLQHGDSDLAPDDADFENYRISIQDSNGDFLSYQAKTINASSTYSGKAIAFGQTYLVVENIASVAPISNVRLSNRVNDGPRDPYFDMTLGVESPTASRLTYGNVVIVPDVTPATAPAANVLYATPPVEFYDFPQDVFEGDGNYTLNAFAENDDGTRISPQASVVLNIQQGAGVTGSNYAGYDNGVRTFEGTAGVSLAVYGLTIRDN